MPVPAVSILMPTYNGAAYLDAQVGSILKQDFIDFELVIVDDGSTDQTRAIIERHAADDPRIRVLRSDGNEGQKVRLGELVRAASADLLAFSDQDDIWDAPKLGRLLAAKGDKAAAFGPSHIIDADGQPQGMTLLDMLPPLPSDDDRLVYLFKPMISAHALLIDRTAFNEDALRRTHPFDWLVSLDAAFSRGVVYVPDAITYHRIHQTNQSNGRSGRRLPLFERYAWPELRRRFSVRGTERWMLVQRLEYMSYSPLVDDTVQRIARRAHDACVHAWFDQNRPLDLNNRRLLGRLVEILQPLATNQTERQFARKELTRLVRSSAQPANVAWQVGSFLRGRTMPRKRS